MRGRKEEQKILSRKKGGKRNRRRRKTFIKTTLFTGESLSLCIIINK